MTDSTTNNHAAFIWSVADLLRGDYKQSDYGKVILPLTVIRRLDCVLEATKPAVLHRFASWKGKVENVDPILESVAEQRFFNTSPRHHANLTTTSATVFDRCTLLISTGVHNMARSRRRAILGGRRWRRVSAGVDRTSGSEDLEHRGGVSTSHRFFPASIT